MSDPFVVVGGDAAGLSAASKCLRTDPDRDVIVFEKGSWISYAHCGTPYFVKGEVEHLTDLLSLSPAAAAERGIDLRRGHEVVGVDTDAGTVTVAADGETTTQAYSDLLVATGAHAVSDPIEGSSLDGVFTLHGLDHAAAIRSYLTPPDEFDVASLGGGDALDERVAERYGAMAPPETVAIVGAGYVGVEMAEAFAAWDLDVHLFQRSERPVPGFGDAVGDAVTDHLRESEVTLHFGEEVARLGGTDGGVGRVVYAGGAELSVDAALVGIGIRPNTDLLDETSVDLGESGAVATDEHGRTSVSNVYAAGDVAEMPHTVTGEPTWNPLGLPANRAGRAIGATVGGAPTPVGRVSGTAMVKVFDLECGRAGFIDHEQARDAGFDPISETVTAGSRSGYYPGSAETTVTLTADRDTGRLLGGSVVGTDRAAIRIDTIATALGGGMTVAELERQDLGYAPPFSPVWDPVLVAAKVLNGSIE